MARKGSAVEDAEQPEAADDGGGRSSVLRRVGRDADDDMNGVYDGRADLGHATLSALVRLRPFMAYFCWLADRQFPAHHRPETRVAAHRARSRRLYATCVVLDVLVLVVAVAFANSVAYKSVWL